MKTLKLGMLVTALMLIAAGFFAGCKANIATPVSPDSFALNADEYQTGTNQFKVLNITTEKYADKDEYRVKVTFNYAVNEEGVKNGVKFYKLTDAAGQKSWKMPVMTEIESKNLNVDDTIAYFTIPAKDIKLYVYVKASETKAINGMKLNEDGDEIWGEEGDDDYADVKDLGTAPVLTGNVNHNKKVGGLNDTLTLTPTLINPAFKTGTGAETYLVKKVEINATSFLTNYIDGPGNGDLDAASKTAKIGEFTDILNKHLKLKQFNWKENKWENITLDFTYDGTNKKWVSNVTVEKDRCLAFQWENINDIKMTFVKYAYPLRLTLKNNTPILSDNFADAKSGTLSLEEGDIWPDLDKLTVNRSVNGQVTITLSAAGVNFPFYIENGWHDVKEDNKDSAKKPLFAGFKPETVVKENFKCTRTVDGKEVLMSISQISLVQSDVMNYPEAFDTIIIKFAENVQAENVYISPNVRSAAFEGSYNDGGLKGKKIPELCFTNIKASENPYEWKGWLKRQ